LKKKIDKLVNDRISNMNYLKKISLKRKKIFIVGGLGLIGQETSKALYQLGGNIYVLDNNFPKKYKNKRYFKKRGINFINFDCSNLSSLEKNFNNIIVQYGCPDIFINSSYPRSNDWPQNSFTEIKLKSLRKNIESNLISQSWLAKIAAEKMTKFKSKNSDKSIIFVGSIYGLLGQDLSLYKNTKMRENMTYSIIKGGITNLTRQMASFYGRYNIRVNTLAPGAIDGPVAGLATKQSKIFINNFLKKNPIKKLGKPSDVAGAAIFLSSEISTYITGSTIIIDGGWTII